MTWSVLVGYGPIDTDLEHCPGSPVAVELNDAQPLELRFTCWCGSTRTGIADDAAELAAIVEQVRAAR